MIRSIWRPRKGSPISRYVGKQLLSAEAIWQPLELVDRHPERLEPLANSTGRCLNFKPRRNSGTLKGCRLCCTLEPRSKIDRKRSLALLQLEHASEMTISLPRSLEAHCQSGLGGDVL